MLLSCSRRMTLIKMLEFSSQICKADLHSNIILSPYARNFKGLCMKKREEYLNQDQPCTSWEQSLHPNEDWLKSEMFIIMTRILWKIEKVIYAVKLKKENDKAFENTWKGALFCWRRRGLDNPVDNCNTCELTVPVYTALSKEQYIWWTTLRDMSR